MKAQRKLISVVIPVFNNKESLQETCSRIFKIQSESFSYLDIEILFVDDDSQDGSWGELEKIQSIKPEHISLIKLSRNFGQLSAIFAGYDAAKGDAIITVSADLQDPITLMAEMVSLWDKGQDIIIAYRKSREDDFAATFFSKIAYGIARKANSQIPEGGFDYLLLSRRAKNILCSFQGRHRFFQGDVLWLGFPTTFIPYIRERRKYGKSGWTFLKKLKYFIDLVIDSSYLPIRLMSALGVLTAISGLLYAVIIFYAWFVNSTPFTGWAPIMVALLFIGGLIMVMLGIIGEYIWRIHDDIKQKPLYLIEKHLPINQSFSNLSAHIDTNENL